MAKDDPGKSGPGADAAAARGSGNHGATAQHRLLRDGPQGVSEAIQAQQPRRSVVRGFRAGMAARKASTCRLNEEHPRPASN